MDFERAILTKNTDVQDAYFQNAPVSWGAATAGATTCYSASNLGVNL